MENNDILDTNFTSGLVVNERAKSAFSETGSWGKFFAILGFIYIGLLIIIAIGMFFFMGSFGDAFGPEFPSEFRSIGALIYLVMAVLFIIPYVYLWQFSAKVKSAINSNDEEQFSDAIVSLKSYNKYWGIFTIIILGLSLIHI